MYALWGEVFNLVKVIVVDDEYLAREGMKRTINWAKYGCVFCGEAGDGCEGIELAEKVRPDLIITDIKMPWNRWNSHGSEDKGKAARLQVYNNHRI